jgi:peptidoglycan/LPS O-acetylase OafA/YrhL
VFVQYVSDGSLSGQAIAAMLVAIGIAATLSWRFLELPFRSRDAVGRTRIFTYATASALFSSQLRPACN